MYVYSLTSNTSISCLRKSSYLRRLRGPLKAALECGPERAAAAGRRALDFSGVLCTDGWRTGDSFRRINPPLFSYFFFSCKNVKRAEKRKNPAAALCNRRAAQTSVFSFTRMTTRNGKFLLNLEVGVQVWGGLMWWGRMCCHRCPVCLSALILLHTPVHKSSIPPASSLDVLFCR